MKANNCRYSTIDFIEQNYRVKNFTKPAEQEAAHRLRHKIFVDELKWVAARENGLEIDPYDGKNMVPLGVFDKTGRIIAHLRITLPLQPFMMEIEFGALIDTPIHKTAGTVEISRVCTAENTRTMKFRTPCGHMHVSMLLYKGLYHWCSQNRIHDMHMVVERKMLRLLRMSCFPCRTIGKTTIMPDGISAVAVRIDWREFVSINRMSKPHLLAWFNNTAIKKRAA